VDLYVFFKTSGGISTTFSIVCRQGTILDRIDYNIEQTATHVDKGLSQLQKAEKYQKKNRKMLVIAVLFVIVIIMLIILFAVKVR